MAGTPGSNSARVRAMWDAFNQEGLEGILRFAAPEARWEPYSATGRAFSSTAEYADFVRGMSERGEVLEAALTDVREHGDCVVVSGRMRLRRDGAMSDSNMYWVHRFRDGMIVWTGSFLSLSCALEAAELQRDPA